MKMNQVVDERNHAYQGKNAYATEPRYLITFSLRLVYVRESEKYRGEWGVLEYAKT